MSYLPELPAPVAPRYEPGPLGRWLREALLTKLSATEAAKAEARLELRYADRRLSRRPLEAKPALQVEGEWLIALVLDDHAALGLTYQDAQSVQGVLRRALRAWDEG